MSSHKGHILIDIYAKDGASIVAETTESPSLNMNIHITCLYTRTLESGPTLFGALKLQFFYFQSKCGIDLFFSI